MPHRAAVGVRAVRAADPAGSVRSVSPWAFEDVPGGTGRIIRTDHYAIYTTESEPIITDRLPGFMEAALPQYAGAIAPLVMHSTVALALASAGMLSIGVVSWVWGKRRLA